MMRALRSTHYEVMKYPYGLRLSDDGDMHLIHFKSFIASRAASGMGAMTHGAKQSRMIRLYL